MALLPKSECIALAAAEKEEKDLPDELWCWLALCEIEAKLLVGVASPLSDRSFTEECLLEEEEKDE